MKRLILVNTFSCESGWEKDTDYYLEFSIPVVPGLIMVLKKAFELDPLDAVEAWILDSDTHPDIWADLNGRTRENKYERKTLGIDVIRTRLEGHEIEFKNQSGAWLW